MRTMKMISVMAAVFALAISGCKKGEITEPEIYKPSARQFHVNLTDSPGDFKRLDITVDKVEAWHDSKGWITLSSSFRTINVISLSDGDKTSLAAASHVQTGHYSRLRIHFVDANSVTVHSAVTIGTLFIEAGSVSRLTWGGPMDQWVEMAIDREVSSSAGVEVLLDFDAAASVYAGSNSYVINPVMREIANAITGARGAASGANVVAATTFYDGTQTYSALGSVLGTYRMCAIQPGTYSTKILAPGRTQAEII